MGSNTAVDAQVLREEVKAKYREVAIDPHAQCGGGILCRREQSLHPS
jgi:hypothetical protein